MEELMELARKKLHPDYDEPRLKQCLCDKFAPRFAALGGSIRSMDEVCDNLFAVLDKETLPSLDGMGDMVKDSLNMLLVAEGLPLTDKRRYMNDLLMKYEAFLKKLSYLVNGKEVENREADKTATLANAIFSIRSLRQLKYMGDDAHRQFFNELTLVRDLRNTEAHASMTVTEQEVNAAIGVIIDMYLYAVGTNITELEMAEGARVVPFTPVVSTDENPVTMAAESFDVSNLPEEERIDLLRRAILILQGYNPKKSPFCKQRHWESLFRIAADHGFVIDGTPGYEQFKRFVDAMNLRDQPAPLTVSVLERYNVGIYAQDFSEWTSEGLTGNKLKEFDDIKQVAELFKETVERVVKQR